jgi:hypothetical protein
MTLNMIGEMSRLIGIWNSDPGDSSGVESCGRATLEFRADGSLVYTVHESDRDQVMLLRFRLGETGFIVTDQPSSPRTETTAYEITPDSKLVLAFGGEKARYVGVPR